jgi:Ca2+-binding EF-hand superfamily protein
MKRIAGLLVATTHLGFAAHAAAESPTKGNQAHKRLASAVGGAQVKRIEALGGSLGRPPPKTEPKDLFGRADLDRDGSVSFGEFATIAGGSLERRILKRFHQLDRNHDGRCTRSEVNKMSAARFERFDLNHDGAFTQKELAVVMTRELTARLEQVYARLDVDRDGRFSLAELTPAPAPRKPAPPERKLQVARRGVASTH